MCFFYKEMFWSALSAIGTFLAVVVSLYLANRKEKEIRKLEIHQQVNENFIVGVVEVIFTLENIGNRPIIINDIGFKVKNSNSRDLTIHGYLKNNNKFPLLIKPNEATIVGYVINKNDWKYNKVLKKQLESKIGRFVAFDTLGNMH